MEPVPIFQDDSVTPPSRSAIYRRAGVLWREGDPDGNPWGLRFLRMFDMANDSGLFRTRAELGVRRVESWKPTGSRKNGVRHVAPVRSEDDPTTTTTGFGTYRGAAQDSGEPEVSIGCQPDIGCTTASIHGGYAPIPFYWVAEEEVEARLDDAYGTAVGCSVGAT